MFPATGNYLACNFGQVAQRRRLVSKQVLFRGANILTMQGFLAVALTAPLEIVYSVRTPPHIEGVPTQAGLYLAGLLLASFLGVKVLPHSRW
jgi:hypothetical protein